MDNALLYQHHRARIKVVLSALLKDRQFHLAILGGIMVVAILALLQLPTVQTWLSPWLFIQLVLIFPLLEEAVFRGLIQETIARRFNAHLGPLSHANIATSILFVLAHLFNHPALWAIAIFIPSLIFGYFRERYNHLLPPILLHIIYNSCYFLILPLL
ncbi:MAG: JDVT-CTERM system glutamic-type intramembrane protease [Pseudomonadota bacterium]